MMFLMGFDDAPGVPVSPGRRAIPVPKRSLDVPVPVEHMGVPIPEVSLSNPIQPVQNTFERFDPALFEPPPMSAPAYGIGGAVPHLPMPGATTGVLPINAVQSPTDRFWSSVSNLSPTDRKKAVRYVLESYSPDAYEAFESLYSELRHDRPPVDAFRDAVDGALLLTQLSPEQVAQLMPGGMSGLGTLFSSIIGGAKTAGRTARATQQAAQSTAHTFAAVKNVGSAATGGSKPAGSFWSKVVNMAKTGTYDEKKEPAKAAGSWIGKFVKQTVDNAKARGWTPPQNMDANVNNGSWGNYQPPEKKSGAGGWILGAGALAALALAAKAG